MIWRLPPRNWNFFWGFCFRYCLMIHCLVKLFIDSAVRQLESPSDLCTHGIWILEISFELFNSLNYNFFTRLRTIRQSCQAIICVETCPSWTTCMNFVIDPHIGFQKEIWLSIQFGMSLGNRWRLRQVQVKYSADGFKTQVIGFASWGMKLFIRFCIQSVEHECRNWAYLLCFVALWLWVLESWTIIISLQITSD